MQLSRHLALIFALLLAAACGGEELAQPLASPPVNDGEALRRVTATSPSAATLAELPTPPPQATAIPLPPATEATPAAPLTAQVAEGRYAIDQVSRSEQGALADVSLRLLSAAVDADRLVLQIAFQNETDRAFEIIGDGLNPDHVRLVEASGASYSLLTFDPQFERLDPADGFAPGGANVGELTFALPATSGPLTLSLAPLGYAPLTFALDQPLLLQAVADGIYALNQTLYSSQQILVDIALELRQIAVESQAVTFDVAFINQGFRGLDLTGGLSGFDVWLIDADGRQYRPQAVSPSLQESIDPLDGWRPGEAHAGTITFQRPQAPTQMRFIFREYSPLTLQFDGSGLVSATITSATGAAAPPPPTPRPEFVQRQALQAVLDRQADALLNNNIDNYIQTFAPALQAEIRTLARRQAQLPLQSLTIKLANDFEPDTATNRHDAVVVDYTHHFTAIEDNPFVFSWRYTFERQGQEWIVVDFEQPVLAPYWLVDDYQSATTQHFLLLLRPVAHDDLEQLSVEVENAYRSLSEQGLELEERYLVLLTATQAEFQQVTNQSDSRLLGLAFNRYLFDDSTVRSTNRAFALNDEAFDSFNAERQTTVTHELAHLAFAKLTRPFTPPWLSEGAAVYYAGQLESGLLLDPSVLQQIDLLTLTQADILGEHDATRVNAEYAFSGNTYAYLVDQFGEQAVRDFYASFADLPVELLRDQLTGSLDGAEADRAFRELSLSLTQQGLGQHFGLTIEELDEAVKRSIVE